MHELTQRSNGFVEMAYAGDTPWHRLGNKLEQGASIEEWQKMAGMDWEIKSSTAMYSSDGQNIFNYPTQRVLYRSDNLKPLSIVSNRYQEVQPKEVLEFFRDLVDEHGFKLHTAGTLMGGKRFWGLAETGKFAEVSKDDGVGGYLLLSTSCDRSLATTARFTTIRVVCNNTLTQSLGNNKNTVSFSHMQTFNHGKVKQELGSAVESFGGFIQLAQALQNIQMNSQSSHYFLKRLINATTLTKPEGFDATKTKGFQKIMELFDGSAKGSEMAGHTRWGMLNAVTEYVDHHTASRTSESRLNNAWFGYGEIMKNQALDIITTVV